MLLLFLDYETSGLNVYHDDIIEIAAKIYDTSKYFQCLLKPKSNKPISEKITQITGITNEILMKDGIRWEKGYQMFFDWISKLTNPGEEITIISHNGLSFDFLLFKRMIKEASEINCKTVSLSNITFIDSLLISKRLLPTMNYYRQSSLCKYFNIEHSGAHRALNDVIALENLYSKLMEKLDNEYNNKVKSITNPSFVINYQDMCI